MADAGNTNSNVEVFLDEVRSKMSGTFDYTPKDANDKWIFAEVSIDATASADLLAIAAGAGSDYPDYFGTSTAVASGDQVLWVAIKSLTTTATEGIGIAIDGGDARYNGDILVVGPNELFIFKCPNNTVANLHARSCTLHADNYPSGQGSATINAHVAAILDDVA